MKEFVPFRNRKMLAAAAIAFAAVCTMALAGCGAGEPQSEDTGEEEYAETLGDYTVAYLQHGPLVIVDDNRKGEGEPSTGAIGAGGKLVIPCEYDSISYAGSNRYIVSLGDDSDGDTAKSRKGIVDEKGGTILPCEYADINPDWLDSEKGEARGTVLPARKDGDGPVGFIDIADGRTVIEPKYMDAGVFCGGLAAVQLENEKWGYIDGEGNLVIDAVYEEANAFDDGSAIVIKNGKTAVIDREGSVLLSCKEPGACISEYRDGRAILYGDEENSFRVVDEQGNQLLSIHEKDVYFDSIAFAGDFILVSHRIDGDPEKEAVTTKTEFYDRDGNELFRGKYADVSFLSGRLIVQDRKTKQYGLLDGDGREILPCEYQDLSFMRRDINAPDYDAPEERYAENVIFMQKEKDGPCMLADENGKPLTKKGYDAICDFSKNGLAAAVSGGRIGFLDTDGKEVIPCEYADFMTVDQSGSPAKAIEQGDGKGYVEDMTAFFPDGLAALSKEKDGKYALVDSKGNAVTDFIYTTAWPPVKESYDYGLYYHSDWIYAEKEDGASVLVDADGRETALPGGLSEIDIEYGDGLFAVQKEGDRLYAFMDSKGNLLTDFVFDLILDNA